MLLVLLFLKRIVMGVPVVFPLNKPLTICGISSSFLGVVPLAPGFLLSISSAKSSTDKLIPDGQPSTVSPTLSPCDSPKILTLKILPNELIFIQSEYFFPFG